MKTIIETTFDVKGAEKLKLKLIKQGNLSESEISEEVKTFLRKSRKSTRNKK